MRSDATPNPLCFTPARELARLIRDRHVSAREVMQAHLAQVARLQRHEHLQAARKTQHAAEGFSSSRTNATANGICLAQEISSRAPPGR